MDKEFADHCEEGALHRTRLEDATRTMAQTQLLQAQLLEIANCKTMRGARRKLLRAVMTITDTSGPCSLLIANRFFSEGGRLLQAPVHANVRGVVPTQVVRLWDNYIGGEERKENEIEQALYRQCQGKAIVFVTREEMMDEPSFLASQMYRVMNYFVPMHLAYLVIRYQPDELCVVCLRKRADKEAPFTPTQRADAAAFASIYIANFMESLFSKPDVSVALQAELNNPGRERRQRLTYAEVEVFDLLLEGYVNAQIAGELYVTEETVKTHVKHIYGKLEVGSRSELLARAGLPTD